MAAGSSMIIVTGGAGFIGSNLVAALEERGEGPLVVCDTPGAGGNGRTVAKRKLEAVIEPAARSGCSSPTTRATPTAANAATSSGSAIASPSCFGYWTIRR